ncbi:hypothetical protein [Xanthomonas sp. NCPPB 1754]|uniref:hypothetical protein n=1 Tax=Xanthomonas sp. NCPPB 1754 TaxID=487536 RepID=UPI003557CFDB
MAQMGLPKDFSSRYVEESGYAPSSEDGLVEEWIKPGLRAEGSVWRRHVLIRSGHSSVDALHDSTTITENDMDNAVTGAHGQAGLHWVGHVGHGRVGFREHCGAMLRSRVQDPARRLSA